MKNINLAKFKCKLAKPKDILERLKFMGHLLGFLILLVLGCAGILWVVVSFIISIGILLEGQFVGPNFILIVSHLTTVTVLVVIIGGLMHWLLCDNEEE